MFESAQFPTLLILVVLLVIASIKVIREYERAVVFRLGRLLLPPRGPKGPGIIIIIPFIDKWVQGEPPAGCHGRPASGRDNQGQRVGEGERRVCTSVS